MRRAAHAEAVQHTRRNDDQLSGLAHPLVIAAADQDTTADHPQDLIAFVGVNGANVTVRQATGYHHQPRHSWWATLSLSSGLGRRVIGFGRGRGVMLKLREGLADALVAEGVEVVFALMGRRAIRG